MRFAVFLLAPVFLACAPPTPSSPGPRVYKTVEELPDEPTLPELFASSFSEDRVRSAEDWRGWRRDELNDLFTHYAYGPPPPLEVQGVRVVAQAQHVGGFAVDYLELEADIGDRGDRALHVAVFSPAGARGVPAVLGPNRCGNQTIVDDDRVRMTNALDDGECGTGRGGAHDTWPVERIAAAGLALVTFHQSELSYDSQELSDGLMLSAWAKGNSLALDVLERIDTPVDAARVGVFGHSRRGKVALLTAARDPRVAAVVAHQSGTLGQSILRDRLGESLVLITGLYPWWFERELSTFVGFEDRLPFDQHQLVALAAPRPVLLVDGSDDSWADPAGSLAAARAADAAWELCGDDGLVEDDGVPREDATLVWKLRPGDHDTYREDWEIFLPFLVQHL